MNSCECQKDQNGYFKVKCITQKCSDCKDVKPPELKCQNSEEITSVYQFGLTEKSYIKTDKSGQCVTKVSKQTEKVLKSLSWKSLHQLIGSFKEKYLLHKFQVHNDHLHWPQILSIVNEFGPIFTWIFRKALARCLKFTF